MRLPRRLRHESAHARGQAMVEAALVLTIVVMVLLLTIDFGRAYFSYISLRNAAREAAIYGGYNPDESCSTGAEFEGLRYEVAKEMRLGDPVDWTLVPCDTGGDVQIISATSGCYAFTAPSTYSACPDPLNAATTFIYRVEVRTQFNPVSPLVGLLTGNGFGNPVPMRSVSSSPVLVWEET